MVKTLGISSRYGYIHFPNAVHRDIGNLKVAQNFVSLKENRCYNSWYLFHLKV